MLQEERGVRVVFEPSGFARAIFFSLLAVAAAAGAMGLPLLLSLAGLAAVRPAVFRQVLEKRPVGLAFLALLAVWAAASAAWSPTDEPTALKVTALLVLGLLFAAAAAAGARAARLTLAGGLAAFIVLAVLLGVEAGFGLPLNRAAMPGVEFGQVNMNPSRGLVVLLALAWPAVAWLIAGGGAARAVAALLVTVSAGVLSLQFGQNSTAVGFAVGFLAFGFAFIAPALAIRGATLGLAAWLIAAPFATPLLFNTAIIEAVPLSWAARIGIWRYTCARIVEQPWIGHGIDAGRVTTDMISIRGLEMRGIQVHPHSASLQVWFDLGAVGAVLAAGVLIFGGWRLGRSFQSDKPAAAAAAAVLAMFGLIANIGWSLWQEWWMATLLLSAALVAAVGARNAN